MKFKKLNILISLFLIICFLTSNGIAAEVTDLKIKLNIYEPASDGQKLDYTDDILLSLEIINNNNYWVAIGNKYDSNTYLNLVIKNKDDQNINYYDYFADEILIPPSTTTTILIPFDYYNEMAIEERIDSWKIKPELNFKSIKYYNTPFTATEINPNSPFSITTNPAVGNILSFDVEDPNAVLLAGNNDEGDIIEKGKNYFSKTDKSIFDDILSSVFTWIIIVCLAGFAGYLKFVYKKN